MCSRWAEFLQDVDYHGPARIITRQGGCCRLLFWLLILLVAWGLLLYYIVASAMLYYHYPVKSETYVQRRSEMVFPAITICNKAPLFNPGATTTAGQSERDFYSTNGYALNQVVESCEFKPMGGGNIAGINCSQELDFIQTQVFPYGNCYTFNSAVAGDGASDDEQSLRKTNRTGLAGGLVLTVLPSNGPVDTQHARYLPGLIYDTVQGLVMAVHNPREPPDLRRQRKFQITAVPGANNPSKRYDIVITRAREYRALSAPYGRRCEGAPRGPSRFRLPKKLTNQFMEKEEMDGDSPEECVKKCVREEMRERNNCTLYDFQDSTGPNYQCTKVTGPRGARPHDLTDAKRNIDTEASHTVDESLGECGRECPRPCVHADYDYDVNEYASVTGQNTINVFFADFLTEATDQMPAYSMQSLMQDIGLHFLLLVGFSFISFMHLLEFLIDLCLYGCQRKREVGDDEENQANGTQ